MPNQPDLLEVAANGAMPDGVRPFREMDGETVWYDCERGEELPLRKCLLADLACIGMVRFIAGRCGMGWLPESASFQSLLKECRTYDDWRTDAGGGA